MFFISCKWLGGFLATAALLAAVLLVWSQFWNVIPSQKNANLSEEAGGEASLDSEHFRLALGNCWLYLGILLALAGLAVAAATCFRSHELGHINQLAVILVVTSFLMTVIAVLQSLFSMSMVLLGKARLDEPNVHPRTEKEKKRWLIASGGAILGCILVSVALAAVPVSQWPLVVVLLVIGVWLIAKAATHYFREKTRDSRSYQTSTSRSRSQPESHNDAGTTGASRQSDSSREPS